MRRRWAFVGSGVVMSFHVLCLVACSSDRTIVKYSLLQRASDANSEECEEASGAQPFNRAPGLALNVNFEGRKGGGLEGRLRLDTSGDASVEPVRSEPDARPIGAQIDAGLVAVSSADAGLVPSQLGGAEPSPGQWTGPAARNVIFLVADGLGPEQVDATRMFLNGNSALLSVEQLEHQALVTTDNAEGGVTDSAAAATALATGRKVSNGVLSVALPGDGQDLLTALEVQAARGKSTGLITIHTALTDATPAAFAAHTTARGASNAIATAMLQQTRPQVLFGGVAEGFAELDIPGAGYVQLAGSQSLDQASSMGATHFLGLFSDSPLDRQFPSLLERTEAALEILSRNPEGFFLLVEQELTDTAGHRSDLPTVLDAAVQFERTVQGVLAWAQLRADTLVIVGSDHETGGLQLLETSTIAGVVPAHRYTANGGHSSIPVQFFATGPGSERLQETLDNTEIFPILAGLSSLPLGRERASAAVVSALDEATPGVPFLSELRVDEDSLGRQTIVLLKFESLSEFATQSVPSPQLDAGRPRGSLVKAELRLEVTNGTTTGLSIFPMGISWTSQSTWESFGVGGPIAGRVPGEPDVELAVQAVGSATFDVTQSVERWLQAPASNHGWLLVGNGSDGLVLERPGSANPPQLTLFFDVP